MHRTGLTCLSFRRVCYTAITLCMVMAFISACASSILPSPQPPVTTQPTEQLKKTPSSIVLVYRSPEPSAIPLSTFTPAPTETPNNDPSYFYGSLTITMDYAGQTVELKKGQNFLLSLGDNFNWQVTFEPADIVSRNLKITPEAWEQGVFVARKLGKTTLQVVGDPICRQQDPPCSRPSVLFRLKLVVK